MRKKRIRLRIDLEPTYPKPYLNLRFWWLHELRQLRAKRRVSGLNVKKDIRLAQKELAKLRSDWL